MTDQILLCPVPLEQLKIDISEIVKRELANHFSNTIQEPQTEIINRKQAAALLGVSLPTLLEWTKSGKITGYRISSRIRYKRAELENSLKQIQSLKRGGH
ncbi:MAG: helix-turn-helix domain-containing protein [Flavisolibacter sp.]